MQVFMVSNETVEPGILIQKNPYPKYSFAKQAFSIEDPNRKGFVQYKDQKHIILRAGLKMVVQPDQPEPPKREILNWIKWQMRQPQPQKLVLFPEEDESEKALIFWDVHADSGATIEPDLSKADWCLPINDLSWVLKTILILSPDNEVNVKGVTFYPEDNKERGLYMTWSGANLTVESRITDRSDIKWKTVKIFK